MMTTWKTTARKWGLGFIAGTVCAWLVAAQFTNGMTPFQYDAALDEYGLQPGVTATVRSEGWADTVIGTHGLLAIEADTALSNRPKIILWGDSHTEAHQVPDPDKPSSVYNALASESEPFCVNRGRSGLSVADYYFKIENTEKLMPGVVAHAIVLSSMKDTLPDRQTETHAQFHHSPWRLIPGNNKPSDLALKYGLLAHILKIRPLYDVGKKILSMDLRFTPGIIRSAAASTPRSKKKAPQISYEEGWAFLLKRLKEKTTGNILFIYCPTTPMLRNGKVDTTNHEAARLQRFTQVCRENGIGVIDMTPAFISLYERENILPRGFFNSYPGRGHINEAGHRLIGKAIHTYVRERMK